MEWGIRYMVHRNSILKPYIKSPFLLLIILLGLVIIWLASRTDAVMGKPLLMTWNYDPQLYDPHQSSDPIAYSIFRHICEPLFYEDYDGTIKGLLAQDDIVYTNNGQRLIIELRPDIYFHDGLLLDAAAVKQSFDRLKMFGMSPLISQFRNVQVEITSPNQIAFELPSPNYDFARLSLSNPYAAIVNTAADGLPSCTGPYKFTPDLYTKDHSIILVSTPGYHWPPDYFKNKNRSKIPQINVQFVPEREQRFDMLLDEQVCLLSINSEQFKRIESDQRFTFFEALGGVTYLGFNFLDERWLNLEARQAVATGLNKLELAQMGPFVISNMVFGQATTGYDERAATFGYSFGPIKSKQLLNKGWQETSFSIDDEIVLLFPTSNTYRELALTIQQQLRTIGLQNVRLHEVPRKDILQKRQEFDLLLFDYAWGDYTALSTFFGSGPRNLLSYTNSDIPALIEQSLATKEPRVKQNFLLHAQKIVLENAILHPLLTRQIIFAVNKNCVKQVRLSPFGELLFHDAYTLN